VQLQLAEVFSLDRTKGAEAWNPSFDWQCLKSGGGGQPTGALADKINADFGSYEAFVEQSKAAAPPSSAAAGPGWCSMAAPSR
jgi:Fe-Mn family superoxide dismutase